MLPTDDLLAARIRRVNEEVAAAADRANRDSSGITVVAVTKTVPAKIVAAAIALGLDNCGENRVQEAAAKIPAVAELAKRATVWHLIGHLQTNKARLALRLFDLIHSVDSLRLAQHLDRQAADGGKLARALLEVNVAREPAKHGFDPDHLIAYAAEIVALPNLSVEGIMTVAPVAANPEDIRPVFRELRLLRDRLRRDFPALAWPHLSMGMSDDYPVAVEEGATMLRIGRAIFGERRLDQSMLSG